MSNREYYLKSIKNGVVKTTFELNKPVFWMKKNHKLNQSPYNFCSLLKRLT